jgi:hypothetical protein
MRKSARQPGAVRAAGRTRSGAERRAKTTTAARPATGQNGTSGGLDHATRVIRGSAEALIAKLISF